MTETAMSFNLTELFCDYCAKLGLVEPEGTTKVVKRTKRWKGALTDKGV